MNNLVENNLTLCLSTYCTNLIQKGYRINGVHKCKYGRECRNMHSLDDFKIKSKIVNWYKKDKSHLNLLYIRNNILSVFEKDRAKINESKFTKKISAVKEMNLIELLNFWFEITCYYRKKQQDSKVNLPTFKLENEEDIWNLQRTLNPCSKHSSLINNPNKIYNIYDICKGHYNCKNGAHRIEDLACIDNLLHGKCDCKTKDQIKEETIILKKELNDLNEIINQSQTDNDDGFKISLSKNKKNKYLNRINQINKEIINLSKRKIHYSDTGLISLDECIKIYNETEPKELINKINTNKKVLRISKE